MRVQSELALIAATMAAAGFPGAYSAPSYQMPGNLNPRQRRARAKARLVKALEKTRLRRERAKN